MGKTKINLTEVTEEIAYCFVCPNCRETVEMWVQLEEGDEIDCPECQEEFIITDN